MLMLPRGWSRANAPRFLGHFRQVSRKEATYDAEVLDGVTATAIALLYIIPLLSRASKHSRCPSIRQPTSILFRTTFVLGRYLGKGLFAQEPSQRMS